jgi:hypothetical protein
VIAVFTLNHLFGRVGLSNLPKKNYLVLIYDDLIVQSSWKQRYDGTTPPGRVESDLLP